MAMRPKVHRIEAVRAITVIARRRDKVDDKHRDLLPDAESSDPRDVLDYLRKFSGNDIPLWVLQADVCDALTLNNWLWWEDRRRELHFLTAGRARGLSLAQLGSQVGVGKQGVVDRIDRLEALLRYDRPDEKITRAERRAARASQLHRGEELDWLSRHSDLVRSLTVAVIDHAGQYQLADDEREWIDELAVDLRDEALTPATMVLLGLAATELRTATAVMALASTRPDRVHSTLNRIDALRSRFAALGRAEASHRAFALDSPPPLRASGPIYAAT
ncbi:hypothetical protein Mycch_5561 (plasmid) [Mycolicibacterium chubuense NBB4]|uniref:Uncharacterized protein n=1 Tax=Mycolicibacterium chubuense (strain NBB4) TaxID=710421 RepID=I4BSG8_MYCCN|nr:hypothetical protein [Mycolicibacterium chubuense]AFM20225.1 hypothetical protein Mycch_5561 [Mycolicibacterium chubuense NBB4]